MTTEKKSPVPEAEADVKLDASLRRQLEAIEQEDVPERILALATELQRLLRERSR